MDTLRLFGQAIQRSRFLQLLLIAGLLGAVYLYYSLGSSSKITAIRDNASRKSVDASGQISSLLSVSDTVGEIKEIDVIVTFTKAATNPSLLKKFRTTVKSLFRFSSVPVNLYILGDDASEKIARNILEEEVPEHKHKYKVYKNLHEVKSTFSC